MPSNPSGWPALILVFLGFAMIENDKYELRQALAATCGSMSRSLCGLQRLEYAL